MISAGWKAVCMQIAPATPFIRQQMKAVPDSYRSGSGRRRAEGSAGRAWCWELSARSKLQMEMRNLSVMGMWMGMGKKPQVALRKCLPWVSPRPHIRLWGNSSILNPQPAEVITAGNNLFVFNNKCSPTISTQSGHCEDKISVVFKLLQ